MSRLKGKRSSLKSRARFLPRWGRQGISIVFFLALFGAGFLWYRSSILSIRESIAHQWLFWTSKSGLTLENVFISGRDKVKSKDILDALTVPLHGPMVLLDMEETYRRILELPWVKSVGLERHWPDTLFIQLQERVPFALWQDPRGLHLVDAEGIVVPGASLESFMTLPVITGPNASLHLSDLLETLSSYPDLKKRIVSAAWVGNRRWNAYLDTKTVLMLPEEGMSQALESFIKYEKTHRITEMAKKRIDLRIPKRIIVE